MTFPNRKRRERLGLAIAMSSFLLSVGGAHGFPFGSPTPAPDQPPHEVPLVEKKKEELSNQEVGRFGKIALAFSPDKWKQAETPNFIVHFRRVTEAQKVVREIEFDLWIVAKTLGATKDRYTKKSHVFVFEDADEWQSFLSRSNAPPWFGSFANGDELFLSVRSREAGGRFDSYKLAHETTHAVVARLYPGDRWPLWLNEGFAEYMAGASVAARKNQTIKRHQRSLEFAEMPLAEMGALKKYPEDEKEVGRLYQTAEKFVRFLMNELPPERFIKFMEATKSGDSLEDGFMKIYGDLFKDFNAFTRKFEK